MDDWFESKCTETTTIRENVDDNDEDVISEKIVCSSISDYDNETDDPPKLVVESQTSYLSDEALSKVPLNRHLMKLIIQSPCLPYTLHKQRCWRKCVCELHYSVCKNILRTLFSDKFEYYESKIYVISLKLLLGKWNGWMNYDEKSKYENSDKIYKQLFDYLYINIKYLKFPLPKISKEVKIDGDESIVVNCSYKFLKTLFLAQLIDIKDFNLLPQTVTSNDEINLLAIYNWPFLHIKFSLPNFEIEQENINHNDFQVMLCDEIKKKSITRSMNTRVYCKPGKSKDSFNCSFMKEYIKQLKIIISREVTDANRVSEIFPVLHEFLKNLSFIGHSIDVSTEYYKNFARFPYIRYFSCSSSQKTDKSSIDNLDIALKQTTFAALKFKLVKFSTMYSYKNYWKFLFKASDFSKTSIKNCVTYTCTLCKPYETKIYSEIVKHMVVDHGDEPPWTCAGCCKTFSTSMLSKNRWHHKNCS